MYKVGDILEVTGNRYSDHGFKKGAKVVVNVVYPPDNLGPEIIYKVTHNDNGRKRSWYVDKRDLVKRRAK